MFRKKSSHHLRKPGDTRFCSNFLLLDNIKSCHAALRSVVTTDEWADWLASQSFREVGENVAEVILSPGFRRRMQELLEVSKPLVAALRLFDGSTPITGKVYRVMFEAVESIKALEMDEVKAISYFFIECCKGN